MCFLTPCGNCSPQNSCGGGHDDHSNTIFCDPVRYVFMFYQVPADETNFSTRSAPFPPSCLRLGRFSILDKARQRKELLCDEVAHLLESEETLNHGYASTCLDDSTRILGNTAPSSITALSEEGEPGVGFEVMYGG